MECVPMWQFISLATLLSWIVLSSYVNLTLKLRSLIQPWVIHHVIKDTPFILQIQRLFHCSFSDRLFSAMSCVVSVPFYTAFLPFLFWSGHGKLARQMTLLIALCDYMGNCIKDVVSAPRPSSPPVRRVTDTKEEKGNVLEYGLPSSHTLNTVCLSGFLLHYTLHYTQHTDTAIVLIGFSLTLLFVGMMVVGRIYLGMHSVVDIIAGLVLGLVILASWITVHDYVDSFVVSGQNVTSFWVALSFLLLFAYPTPEFPTPSYEFHTAFDGVALGIMFAGRFNGRIRCRVLMGTYQHHGNFKVQILQSSEGGIWGFLIEDDRVSRKGRMMHQLYIRSNPSRSRHTFISKFCFYLYFPFYLEIKSGFGGLLGFSREPPI